MVLDLKVKARLGATRMTLQEQAGKPSHAAVSRLQAASLVEVVQKSDFSASDLAEISDLILNFAWASQEDLGSVLTCLTDSTTKQPCKKTRRSNQNYASLSNYFNDEAWSVLTGDATPSAKLTLILNTSFRLGMRLPTEPCVKWLTSLWLVLSEPRERLSSMSELDKRLMLQHFKSQMNSMRSKLADPVDWVDHLPDNPFELQSKFPATWAAAMGRTVPGKVSVDLKQVSEVDMSFGCRGGRPAASMLSRAPFDASSARGPSLQADPTQQFASMFSTFMQSQSRMLEAMITGQGRAPRAASLLGHMLEDRQPQIVLSPRRRSNDVLALPPPPPPASPNPVRDSARFEEVSDSPVQQGGTSPMNIVPTSAASVLVESPTADIGAFLDMLGKRKEEKKKAATADKKPTGSAGSDEASTTLTIDKPLPIDKPKPNPSQPKAKAKSPKPAKAKAKAKASVASDLVLGCAKCRWSKRGCGQCRSPSFTGIRWNDAL